MSDTLEITRQKWQHWINTLAGDSDDSIVKRLNEAAEKIDKIISMQTSAKWGSTEPGLKAFQRAYTSYWREEQQALISMSQHAADFASRVKEALKLLDTNEEEAVEYLNRASQSMPAGPALKGIGQFLPSTY